MISRIALTLFVALVLSSTILAEVLECNKPNEEYQCGSACQRTCANLGQKCPIVNIRCNDDCYCKDGYARNNAGICIPIKACHKVHRKAPRHRKLTLNEFWV